MDGWRSSKPEALVPEIEDGLQKWRDAIGLICLMKYAGDSLANDIDVFGFHVARQ